MRCILLSLAFLLCAGAAVARPGWRVINGTEPKLYEFPSMVSIWLRGMHYCGGTLIDDDTVLTAAHCFYTVRNPQSYDFHVRINAHNFRQPTSKERRVKVTRVITHPGWNPRRLSNDYLILKLAQRVQQSATVKYSPLPSTQGRDIVQPGDMCYVVGWGTMNPKGWPGTHLLQKGAMRVISNTECKAKGAVRRQFQWIGSMHICAKSAYRTTSACKGDSGGPLFCYPKARPGTMIQVGVVSYGDIPCGQTDMPVAYARISNALDWIRRYM